MIRTAFIVASMLLLALAATSQPSAANQDFLISCEGTESNGGGVTTYQYTLQNISSAPVTLTDLGIGTEDPIAANYAFVPTPGFTVSIVPNGTPPFSVLFTSLVKTPHGVIPPASGVPSTAMIWWTGAAVVMPGPGGTITFGFNHTAPSVDQEWHANSSAGWTISSVSSPMAGPLGIFTDGYVHAPGHIGQVPVDPETWGAIKSTFEHRP